MIIDKEQDNWVIRIPTQMSINEKLFLEIKFLMLAQKWYEETRFFSFAQDREKNESYQAILAMGKEILPFILKEMQNKGVLWFSALRAISGENPMKPEHKGNTEKIKQDWIAWGQKKGII